MTTLVLWFRRDLRLTDNPALQAALAAAERIIPVYIDTRAEEGDWTPGEASNWWLHHSLAALAAGLGERGSRLVIRRGPAARELTALLEDTGADGVYWNRLYDPETVARDRELKRALRDSGHHAQSFRAALMVEPWEVETGEGRPYRVFSPFWRNARRRLHLDTPALPPDRVPGPADWPVSLELDALDLLPRLDWADGFAEHWTPGEGGAQARLEHTLEASVDGYARTRELPAVDGTSGLSPHLHFGEVSPWLVYQAVGALEPHHADDVEALQRELGWREFAHHVLFHFPHTPDAPLNADFADFPWRDGHEQLSRAWARGHTGFPIVDAGMRQLWSTGWMHNRVRMIVASLLTKNIRAPWLYGARWFWDTLVDADLASNTLGWQWAGGCGADAAPYFRIFNPVRQGERFDPEGEYVRRWVPELARMPARWIHQPWAAPAQALEKAGVRLGRDYPEPIVDLKRSREEALAALKQLRAG